ncbi:MAG: T9SS type A sorting domain-containing protein [Flavobacteriales bacterium]|jgi:hypothetical protein
MTRIFYTLILCVSCLFISAQDNMLGLSYQVINRSIEVSWEKGNDLNSHYFELEKLDNENIWHGIQYLRPNVDQVTFHTIDRNPSEGVNYFRIKMKSREGETGYSETLEVYFEPLSFDILVYPNPANAWLVINADKPYSEYSVSLMDRYGNTVVSGYTKESSCVLETAQVMEGMYFIKVEGEGASFKQAVVINHR